MRYKLGVDLGGTHIGAGLVDANGNLLKKLYVPTPENRDFDETVKAIIKSVERLLEEYGANISCCDSIGIGSPGVAEEETGKIVFSTNFQWYDQPLGERLKEHFNIHVHVGNDADVAGWAEYLMGAGKGSKSCVTITLGTGVGGGLVLNGRLFSGGMLGGAELGHVTLIAGGARCTCGKEGCAEAYCSASALIRQAEEGLLQGRKSVLKSGLEAKDVVDAARAGDEFASELFANYVENLAHLLSSIINLLAPEIIALGGGVSKAGDFLLEPLRKRVAELVLNKSLPHAKIVCAQMGNDAGIIGAALLEGTN